MAFPISDPTNAVAVVTNVATATTNVVVVITNQVTVVSNVVVSTTNFVTRDISGLEVVNKVNELYSSLGNMLLILLTIIAGIVGVVLPIMLQFYQRREGLLQEKRLDESFRFQLEEAKKSTDDKITKLDAEKQAIEKSLKETEDRIGKKISNLNGSISHTDALVEFKEKKYVNALRRAMVSARQYMAGGERANIGKLLSLSTLCLDKMTKAQIQKEELGERLEKFELDVKALGAELPLINVNKFIEAKNAALNREDLK